MMSFQLNDALYGAKKAHYFSVTNNFYNFQNIIFDLLYNYIPNNGNRQQIQQKRRKTPIMPNSDNLFNSFLTAQSLLFLAQANLKLFNHLSTLKSFTNKSIQRLSLNIQTKICHPGQIIKKANQPYSLMILQSGQQVGFVTRKRESRLDCFVIERISNTIQQESKLICADLLDNQPLNYDIKSLKYSTVYCMEKTVFEDCISQSKEDYEIYRYFLDSCKYKLNQFRLVKNNYLIQLPSYSNFIIRVVPTIVDVSAAGRRENKDRKNKLVKCRFCQKQQQLFECPRLHFYPFKKTFPLKKNGLKSQERQKRVKFHRNKQEINYYDYTSASNFEQSMHYAGLAHSESCIKSKKQKQTRRNSVNHAFKSLKNRQSYIFTMEMMTQFRQDIQKLKVVAEPAHFQFTLWEMTDCDQICDFKSYFPRFNSNKLDDKYSFLAQSKNYRKRAPKKSSFL